ncbi:12124_t:CDS:2, partial [Funneliformis mosseae]
MSYSMQYFPYQLCDFNHENLPDKYSTIVNKIISKYINEDLAQGRTEHDLLYIEGIYKLDKISKIAGTRWKDEPKEVKDLFTLIADCAKK